MIKKIAIATISIVALILTSCVGENTQKAGSALVSTTTPVAMNIVYINIDSIVVNYELYKKMNVDYAVKVEKVQKELERKGNSFQKKLQLLQTKITNGLITRTGAAEEEQQLQIEQQGLIQYRDDEFAKLTEEEQVMRNTISFNIKQYVDVYNKVKKYDLILSTSVASGTIVTGNPDLDISKEVTKGLNEQYAKEKK